MPWNTEAQPVIGPDGRRIYPAPATPATWEPFAGAPAPGTPATPSLGDAFDDPGDSVFSGIADYQNVFPKKKAPPASLSPALDPGRPRIDPGSIPISDFEAPATSMMPPMPTRPVTPTFPQPPPPVYKTPSMKAKLRTIARNPGR